MASLPQRTVLVIRALASLGKPQTANNLFKVLPRSVFPTRASLRAEALEPATAMGLTTKTRKVLPRVPKRPRKMHRRNPHYVYNLKRDNPDVAAVLEKYAASDAAKAAAAEAPTTSTSS
ncbi:uncharacterized protein AMSG_07889 [Thecamonas trahens ATCC 50062]|uniref:Uncharacterized protein n=1 Tax=Thecamonas trahens ATCC 50062 TaxID=461836 RepID=A0A0L0DHG4_THETB|nr:hypothetical protein AMSG_07889 [Thecamonas trahens ATCC 50062]KNC51809.1 hypothetical protein AMSG_07889 [Thecamonas trahens ATCC 50062]|eukprot:XP_013755675.1 hypothetical protein AMSG_07889 [Thecamonas trahens ATCC 50062]